MSDKTVKQCDHCPCDRAFQMHYAIQWTTTTTGRAFDEGDVTCLDACSTTCALALVSRLTAEGKTVMIRRV